MNEEFSDYEVLVATSVDGGEITQGISWEVDKEKDIVVWCDIAGLMDKGSFDYNGNSITIHGYDKPFTAYIMRKECAEYVISQNSSSTFSVDAILEQLKKNVRVLEQLEETDTRTLQCVDEVKPITDKDRRKGKVLSFDDDGNPVCEVEVDDVEKIKTYRDEASASATSASQSAASASASATSASQSAASASTSAINASTSESNASTMLSDTQGIVKGFDTTVENKQTEVLGEIDSHFSEKTIEFDEYADGTISEIEGIKNQAQALVDNALEIVDPEGFRRDTSANISDLQLFKVNIGALHFNGGTLAVGPSGTTDKMPATFSWCRTIKMNWADWEAIEDFTFFDGNSEIFTNASLHMGASIYKRNNNTMSFAYCNGEQNYLTHLTLAETKQFFDGKKHTICLCTSNGSIKLYRDSLLIKTASVKLLPIASTKRNFRIGNIKSEYSRIYNFNFDVTSAEAPYTLADYQQGKPIPPSLLTGNEINYTLQANSTFTQRVEASNFSLAQGEDGYITANADAVSGSNPYFWLPFGKTLKAGSNIEISLYTNRYSDFGNFGFSLGNSGSTTLVQSITRGNTMTYTLSTDVNCIVLNGARDTALKEDILLSVKADGTLLALEDYIITNGNSKIVFDYSGNNKDATITGDVKGDNDNRVQKLIDFIKS